MSVRDRLNALWPAWIPKSSFVTNFLRTLQGSVIAQLLIVAAIPFLSRVYSPEAFALLQASVAVVAIAVVLSCLRYDVALTVCSDEEIRPLLTVVGFVGPVVSTLLAGGLFVVPTSWLDSIGLLDLKPVVGWFAISILVASFANAMSFLAIRKQEFKALAAAKVLQSVGFITAAILIGAFGAASSGILIADIVGRAVLLVVIAVSIVSLVTSGPNRLGARWSEIRWVLKRYRWFPLISLPGGLVNAAGGSFNTLWMLALFTTFDAGSYAMIERFVVAPVALIGAALQQVYQGRFSASLRAEDQNIGASFLKLLGVLTCVGVPSVLLLVVAAPTVLPMALGSQWEGAARFCQVLAPTILASFIVVPFNMILTLLERQRLQFAWEVGRFLLVTGTWVGASRLGLSPLTTLALVSVATAASALMFLVIAYREVRALDNVFARRSL